MGKPAAFGNPPKRGRPAGARLPFAVPPADDAPEFPVYLALKVDACERRLRGHAGRRSITARWLHAMLDRLATSSDGMLELHGVTSHFVRERLRDLNHGTALQAIDASGPAQYAWTEVLGDATMHSYRQLRRLLGGRPYLALDLWRVDVEFQDEPFRAEEFVDLFKALRDRCLTRRWYSLTSALATESAQYTSFVLRRLRDLVRLGLVAPEGDTLRLTPRARAACHWFALVVHSVEYPVPQRTPSPPDGISPHGKP